MSEKEREKERARENVQYTGTRTIVDPEKIGISVFFNVFFNFFWVTVNYTIRTENCLYWEDFLKSIEHNRKIHNSRNYIEKKFVKTATFICTHDFLWTSDEEFRQIEIFKKQKMREICSRIFWPYLKIPSSEVIKNRECI